MSHRRRMVRYIAFGVGGLLCVVGVLHDIVNIPFLNRAIARGDIAPRLGHQLVANVALAGLALALFGVFLVLSATELSRGKRAAWRIVVVIGLFLLLSGVAAYLWLPVKRVLIASVLGGLLCGPLLLWRKEFLVE
jgi:hypothetical protein